MGGGCTNKRKSNKFSKVMVTVTVIVATIMVAAAAAAIMTKTITATVTSETVPTWNDFWTHLYRKIKWY